MVISILLLAHDHISHATASYWGWQSYLLYTQIGLALLFTLFYSLAIRYRNNYQIHSRFMIATALCLVDPIAGRLMGLAGVSFISNYQFLDFGAIILFAGLMGLYDMRKKRVMWPYGIIMCSFLVFSLPIYTNFMETTFWQQFAHWLASV